MNGVSWVLSEVQITAQVAVYNQVRSGMLNIRQFDAGRGELRMKQGYFLKHRTDAFCFLKLKYWTLTFFFSPISS